MAETSVDARVSTDELIGRREALKRAALLLGGAVSAPTLAGVLAGCGRNGSVGAWHPRALSAEQGRLVAAIAEHIIPETDTPGARSTGVHEFIDEMLASYYPPRERELFLAGLATVDARAQRAYGAPFLGCTAAQQVELVAVLDRDAFGPSSAAGPDDAPDEPDIRERAEGGATPLPSEGRADSIRWITGEVKQSDEASPFFRTMKELTLVGYYTSEAGATEELRHEPVPGRYEGCVPFVQIGRTWAV